MSFNEVVSRLHAFAKEYPAVQEAAASYATPFVERSRRKPTAPASAASTATAGAEPQATGGHGGRGGAGGAGASSGSAGSAPADGPRGEAAVLVPLLRGPSGDAHVLLTRRSPRMNKHAGEVALPGGKRERDDASPIATALREAHEEVGLVPDSVQVLAALPAVASRHLLHVTPVIAVIPDDAVLELCPTEVEVAFTVPLALFLAGERHTSHEVTWQENSFRIHFFRPRAEQLGSPALRPARRAVAAAAPGTRGWPPVIFGFTASICIRVALLGLGRDADFQVAADSGAHRMELVVGPHGRLVRRKDTAMLRSASGAGASRAPASHTRRDCEQRSRL